MVKFRYYITDLFDGDVKGTNDTEKAEQYSSSEDHFVVDTETGKWLVDGREHEVKEA